MKIGVALSSGGARGFAHIAYLQAIDESGLHIDCISGTSMGALIGAFYASGIPAADIHKLVQEIGLFDISKFLLLSALPKIRYARGKRIEQLLRKKLPVQKFEDLRIPMKISAADYWNKEEFVFETGDLVSAICASISIPLIFQPYLFNNRLFIDGGMVNPLPLICSGS